MLHTFLNTLLWTSNAQ